MWFFTQSCIKYFIKSFCCVSLCKYYSLCLLIMPIKFTTCVLICIYLHSYSVDCHRFVSTSPIFLFFVVVICLVLIHCRVADVSYCMCHLHWPLRSVKVSSGQWNTDIVLFCFIIVQSVASFSWAPEVRTWRNMTLFCRFLRGRGEGEARGKTSGDHETFRISNKIRVITLGEGQAYWKRAQ